MWDSSLRAAFECSFDGVVAIDPSGTILDHEPTAAALLAGDSYAALTGQDFCRTAIAEEHTDEFLAEVARLTSRSNEAASGSNETGSLRNKTGSRSTPENSSPLRAQMQLRLKTPQGDELLADVSLCGTTIDGRPAVNVFIRDASDRIRAEARLAQQTLQTRLFQRATAFTVESDSYEDALQHSLGILTEITQWPAGHVFVPNEEGSHLVSADIWHFDEGLAPEVLRPGLSPLAFARGEDLPGHIWESAEPRWLSDALEESSTSRSEIFRAAGVRGVFGFPVMTDDEVIAVMEFYSPEPMAPDPQLLLMVGNIGAQLGRLMERSQAQEQQARQAAIVAASSDAIIGRSLDGTIMTWNKGAERVYRYTADEAIGRPITLLVPDDGKEEQVILDVAEHGRRLENFETIRRRSDGSLIPVSITVSPMHNRSGEVVGTASIERDIAQRKQREEELERAWKAAETAARTKSQFLANVSHELRTPMNAIIGMIDLSFQEQLSPRLRDYMETVRDSSRTLLDLINDVLDFSRMEIGTFQLVEEPFDLRDLLDRTIRTLAMRASEKGLELGCRIHPGVPECLQGDSRRLRQVVMNLVGNAIKFTDEGEVTVNVAVSDSPGQLAGSNRRPEGSDTRPNRRLSGWNASNPPEN